MSFLANPERKVVAATASSGVTAAVVTLLLYAVDLIPGIADMDPTAAGALAVLITGVVTTIATYVAGWMAKHTPRPDLYTPGGGGTDVGQPLP